MAKQKKIKIIIDTREKHPLVFPEEIAVVKRKLDAGDYSLQGYTYSMCIERKGWGDYYNCCMSKWKNFQNQLCKIQTRKWRAIIVEGSLSRVYKGFHRGTKSDFDRIVYVTSVISMKYHIPILFAENRDTAQTLCLNFLQVAHKEANKWHSSSQTPSSKSGKDAKGSSRLQDLIKYRPR